jgi:hypothetical protein
LRTTLTAAVAALALATAGASPAWAKRPVPPFTSTATIDCGTGPIAVGAASDDVFAPLIDPVTGRRYEPVAFDIAFGDQEIQVSQGKVKKHSPVCAYRDSFGAAGTVTLKKF